MSVIGHKTDIGDERIAQRSSLRPHCGQVSCAANEVRTVAVIVSSEVLGALRYFGVFTDIRYDLAKLSNRHVADLASDIRPAATRAGSGTVSAYDQASSKSVRARRKREINIRERDMKAADLKRTLCGVMLTLTFAAAPALAQNVPQCVVSGSPAAGWGFNSVGYIMLASGGSCVFAINVSGEILSSSVSQNPQHGTLQQLNASSFVYTSQAGYSGGDTFSVQATGTGQTGSGTSVLTINATLQ
jgi:Bacterial Ig domain